MNTYSISTKELREELPKIRQGLARGNHYTLIYRSKPIGRLEPLTTPNNSKVRLKGGTLRLQASSEQLLTPEYLNQLAAQKYE